VPANPALDWTDWMRLVQAALQPGPAIPLEQLLLVRDLAGRFVRRFDPPEGVTPRLGAVLVLLYPDGSDLRLPLTVRSDQLPSHRGEISLPGGSIDPDEDGSHYLADRSTPMKMARSWLRCASAMRSWGSIRRR
jgi:hypothetical protein